MEFVIINKEATRKIAKKFDKSYIIKIFYIKKKYYFLSNKKMRSLTLFLRINYGIFK